MADKARDGDLPELPMVTVIITGSDRGLDATLDSVIGQTFSRKQVVVAGGDEICKRTFGRLYKPKHPPDLPSVLVGNLKNSDNVRLMLARVDDLATQAAIKNTMMQTAAKFTDLFLFLQAGDRLVPSMIEQCVSTWTADPGRIGLVYPDYEVAGKRQWGEPFGRERLFAANLVTGPCLISRVAFQSCGGFDETHDYDLWLRISNNFLLTHLPICLATLVEAASSLTPELRQRITQRRR